MMHPDTAKAIEKALRRREGTPSDIEVERYKAIRHRQRTVRMISLEDEKEIYDAMSKYPMFFTELDSKERVR